MRTVILSSNDNPDYLKYWPYVSWAWNELGWNTLLFYLGKNEVLMEEYKLVKQHFDTDRNQILNLSRLEGYRDATVVQVARLFGALCFPDDRMIMTGDIDMIPCSDYWNPKDAAITTYGWDLTNQGHFPMCYIAMNVSRWREVMEVPDTFQSIDLEIKKLLDKYPQAKSEEFDKYWGTDQDIITEKLLKQNMRIDIDRTTDGHLALGRADRYDWEGTKNKPNLIDSHMPRGFDLEATKFILNKCFGKLPRWL
jgi:hypothetical protein